MTEETQKEIERLNDAVDAFAIAMKARLTHKALQGKRSWDQPGRIGDDDLISSMREHIASCTIKAEVVDLANLAMMLWWRS